MKMGIRYGDGCEAERVKNYVLAEGSVNMTFKRVVVKYYELCKILLHPTQMALSI